MITVNQNKISEIKRESCKIKAKQLILNSDWAVLPDVKLLNQSEFINYRTILRDYILNPVESPDWPAEPSQFG